MEEGSPAGMREDWRLLVSFLPGNWRELAASTGVLKGLRKDKSAENLLRVLLMHLGCGHSLRETVAGVRLLQAHRDGGARHGGIAAAVPDRRGRLPAGRPGVFDGRRHRLRGAGGRVTVRVNTGTLGFQTPEGQPFDLLAKVSELKSAGALRSWPVRVAAPQGGLVSGRVCAIRKTQEAIRIAQAGIRKEAARKGRQVQPQTLEFARYVMLFTTFPATEFACAEVLEWYRIRWQVELVFKRFKSLAQLGHLPKHDAESAKAWLYGKLLVALLVEKLIGHAIAVSPWGYRLAAASAAQRLA